MSMMPTDWSTGLSGSHPAWHHHEWYTRAMRGRSKIRNIRFRCLRCSWKGGLFGTRTPAKAEFRAHLKTAHPGKSEYLEATIHVEGHCIRCAGAQFVKAAPERHLIDLNRPDEPTHPVYDGISSDERLPWKAGNVEYTVSSKRSNYDSPTCPQHPDEKLRPYRMEIVAIEGRPPSDYLPEYATNVAFQ